MTARQLVNKMIQFWGSQGLQAKQFGQLLSVSSGKAWRNDMKQGTQHLRKKSEEMYSVSKGMSNILGFFLHYEMFLESFFL